MKRITSNVKNDQESSAWLLYINPEIAIALGQYEVVYILKCENHKLKNINGPLFCNQTISWQDKIIKVFDLDCFINMKNNRDKNILYEYIIVIPCVNDNQNVEFMGMKIMNIPVKIQVKDTQLCDYPDNYEWVKLSSSCFYNEKYGIIPILDLTKVFNCINE